MDVRLQLGIEHPAEFLLTRAHSVERNIEQRMYEKGLSIGEKHLILYELLHVLSATR